MKVAGSTFSLSGLENRMDAMAEAGRAPEDICWYVLASLAWAVERATKQALEDRPGLPVLCAGGVSANRLLRGAMEERCGAVFAEPRFSTDNAMGVAILTWRSLHGGAV